MLVIMRAIVRTVRTGANIVMLDLEGCIMDCNIRFILGLRMKVPLGTTFKEGAN